MELGKENNSEIGYIRDGKATRKGFKRAEILIPSLKTGRISLFKIYKLDLLIVFSFFQLYALATKRN